MSWWVWILIALFIVFLFYGAITLDTGRMGEVVGGFVGWVREKVGGGAG